MIPSAHRSAFWGILVAAPGDRQRGGFVAATGEVLMTLDNQTRTEDFFMNRVVGNRRQVFEAQDWPARRGVPL